MIDEKDIKSALDWADNFEAGDILPPEIIMVKYLRAISAAYAFTKADYANLKRAYAVLEDMFRREIEEPKE